MRWDFEASELLVFPGSFGTEQVTGKDFPNLRMSSDTLGWGGDPMVRRLNMPAMGHRTSAGHVQKLFSIFLQLLAGAGSSDSGNSSAAGDLCTCVCMPFFMHASVPVWMRLRSIAMGSCNRARMRESMDLSLHGCVVV